MSEKHPMTDCDLLMRICAAHGWTVRFRQEDGSDHLSPEKPPAFVDVVEDRYGEALVARVSLTDGGSPAAVWREAVDGLQRSGRVP